MDNYWRDNFTRARAAGYLPYKARCEYLLSQVPPCIGRAEAVLEVGCGAGRNLAAFAQAGYSELYGVDISGNAIAVMRERLPDLLREGHIFCESADAALAQFSDRFFSLIFSMAAVQHFTPEVAEVAIPLIAAKAAKCIITIEHERASNVHLWPRDYQALYESLGFVQTHTEPVPYHIWEQAGSAAYREPYTLRVFRRAK